MAVRVAAVQLEVLCDADVEAIARGRLRAVHGRRWPLYGGKLARAAYLVSPQGVVSGPVDMTRTVPANRGWAWWM